CQQGYDYPIYSF
nr:immunoglobulin light chain junction region [Macaca mulatta]MOV61820.1 immunoglobulin light chain junction region [Macaca mulatta]MOV63028.1 immunoglobulin light chain junction region [Macaca mulatta]